DRAARRAALDAPACPARPRRARGAHRPSAWAPRWLQAHRRLGPLDARRRERPRVPTLGGASAPRRAAAAARFRPPAPAAESVVHRRPTGTGAGSAVRYGVVPSWPLSRGPSTTGRIVNDDEKQHSEEGALLSHREIGELA